MPAKSYTTGTSKLILGILISGSGPILALGSIIIGPALAVLLGVINGAIKRSLKKLNIKIVITINPIPRPNTKDCK